MPKTKKILSLSAFVSLNNQKRGDLLADGECQELLNYEINASGVISRRKKTDITGDIFPGYLSGKILKIWAWKPTINPLGSERDYLLAVYTTNCQLWLLKYSTKWVSCLLDGTTEIPVFYNMNLPRIAHTDYGLALVDGRLSNPAKFIEINATDKKIYFGNIGLSNPIYGVTAKNDLLKTVEADAVDIGMGVVRGSIVRYSYTLVLDDGTESNPAPVMLFDDQQYIYKDEEFNPEGYLFRFGIENIFNQVANNNELAGLRNRIKYINIFRSDCLYSEGVDGFSEMLLVGQVPITGDEMSYVDTSGESGAALSWENDTSCRGDDICSSSGMIFISNANPIIRFPFPFSKYVEFKLNNKNSRNYVNSRFKIRLYENEMLDSDGIHLFSWDDLFEVDGTLVYSAWSKLRFFDRDLTTPLKVLHYPYTAGTGYVDIEIFIPYVESKNHNIYLVWADRKAGVGQGWKTWNYGQWQKIGIDLDNYGKMIPGYKVRDDRVLACLSNEGAEILGDDGFLKLSNRANMNKLGENKINYFSTPGFTVDPLSAEYSSSPIPFSLGDCTETYLKYTTRRSWSIAAGSQGYGWQDGNFIEIADLFESNPDKGFACGFIRNHPVLDYDNIDQKKVLLWLGRYQIMMMNTAGLTKFYLYDFYSEDEIEFSGLNAHSFGDNLVDLFYFVSWDFKAGKFFLYVANIHSIPGGSTLFNSDDCYDEVLASDIDLTEFKDFSEYKYLRYFGLEGDDDIQYSLPSAYYGQQCVSVGEYWNASELYNIIQLMKFAPVFREEWLGLDPSDSINKNIEIGVVQDINTFEREGLLKWSSISGRSMPDGNYLFCGGRTTRIHPAPSYLKNGNYLNCVVIFGEQSRQRLLLDGDPGGWRANINQVLIEEQKHYGLPECDKDTLKMIGDALFWKSGDKIFKENSGGLAVLNENPNGEKRVSFPVSERYFSFFNPRNNQLIIHTQYNTWDEEFLIFDLEFILE